MLNWPNIHADFRGHGSKSRHWRSCALLTTRPRDPVSAARWRAWCPCSRKAARQLRASGVWARSAADMLIIGKKERKKVIQEQLKHTDTQMHTTNNKHTKEQKYNVHTLYSSTWKKKIKHHLIGVQQTKWGELNCVKEVMARAWCMCV